MKVYLVRAQDSNAHEGDDGVFNVFKNKSDADKYVERLNDNPHYRRQGISNYTYYVEEWEVE
jgi:hypothetical protein